MVDGASLQALGGGELTADGDDKLRTARPHAGYYVGYMTLVVQGRDGGPTAGGRGGYGGAKPGRALQVCGRVAARRCDFMPRPLPTILSSSCRVAMVHCMELVGALASTVAAAAGSCVAVTSCGLCADDLRQ